MVHHTCGNVLARVLVSVLRAGLHQAVEVLVDVGLGLEAERVVGRPAGIDVGQDGLLGSQLVLTPEAEAGACGIEIRQARESCQQ